ncbi:TDT family transporter [Kineococcus gynurae]|uniref:TDT family transporter n=1 Tax=Kineococcus gynurae TaxID=452979 RepID=A0ABV5LQI0_9ACTN
MSTATAPVRVPRTPVARGLAQFGPNWFTAVMGTGIVATAAATLPVPVPGLRPVATGVWLLAGALLLTLLAVSVAHGLRHPSVARAHLRHPVRGHFYGAPPMALMTVGAGTLLLGPDVVGPRAALGLGALLWALGTVGGLASTVLVPWVGLRQNGYDQATAFGGWLVPVVPPMVSASVGALLVPHAPAGAGREAVLLLCYACAAVSLLATAVLVPVLLTRWRRHGAGPAAAVPTWWIVLGPLGQGVTALVSLAAHAPGTLPAAWVPVAGLTAVGAGVVLGGAALAWLAVVVVLTVRTAWARGGLPFSMTWWSFTFPVGTLVTGAGALAHRTGSPVLAGLAVVLFGLLVTAWLVVLPRTVRGVLDGTLLPGSSVASELSRAAGAGCAGRPGGPAAWPRPRRPSRRRAARP